MGPKEEDRRTVKAATATVSTMNHSDDLYLKSQGFCTLMFDVYLFNDDEMESNGKTGESRRVKRGRKGREGFNGKLK